MYRAVIRDYWRSALCVGAIGFCTGIMRALAIGEPQVGSLVNMLSMAASFVGAITMLALWKVKSVRFNVVGLYRVAFPFVITSFLLLPFSSLEYARWQAAILYAVYSVVIMLMMIQCAQASRDRGINPVFIYGFFGGIVYTLHDVGFLAGTFSDQVRILGIDPLATTALVSLYLLGFMFFIGQGGFRRVLRHDPSAENIELIMLDGRPPTRVTRSTASQLPADDKHGTGAASALEGDFPAEPQAAFPKKPATVAEPMRNEREVDGRDSGQPDGRRRGGNSRSGGTDSQADAPRGRGRRNFEGDFELTDRLSKQAQILREQYRLSARETEVMEYIARGYTVARTAEELIVSENTIRTHSKRIYAKLDVHKKQELIDMLKAVEL